MKGKRMIAVMMCSIFVIFNIGCSRVVVRKIPKNCNQGDKIKGFRYYLPRPYLVVKKSFPVAGGEYIVSGQVQEDGSVKIEDTSVIPKELRERLLIIPPESIVQESDEKKKLHSKENGKTKVKKNGEGEQETKPKIVEKGDQWLKTSNISPSILQKDQTEFEVTVILSKKFPYTELKDIEVGLLPVDDKNKPIPDKFIKINEQKKPEVKFKPVNKEGKEGVDGKYLATGKRSELTHGPNYVLGLLFKGKDADNSSENGTFLVYQSNVALHAMGVEASSRETTTETSQQQTEEPESAKTSTSLTLSGDPRTNPLQKLNDLFDILYLPDFSAQYAVKISGGLGKNKASIGFENGWMMEHASVQIDNSKLGEFIYTNVEKFVDIAAEVAKAKLLPVESAAEELTVEGKKTQADGGEERPTVLLKVRYLFEAAPGLYPILKPTEMKEFYKCLSKTDGSKLSPPGDHILIPYSPFTVIAFNGIRVVQIELIRIIPHSPAAAASGSRSNAMASKKRIIDELKEHEGKIPTNVLPELEMRNITIEIRNQKTSIIIPVKSASVAALSKKQSYAQWLSHIFGGEKFEIEQVEDAIKITYSMPIDDLITSIGKQKNSNAGK